MSSTFHVPVNGATLEVAVAGSGPAVVLVHGFPHTRELWKAVTPHLLACHRVIAPDLRGTGGSSRAGTGYDAQSLAADLRAVLDALDEAAADVVAIDAGVPAAFLLAVQDPARVRRLILMESTLGTLPGAEDFFAHGAPWWFGFHQVPGLAETVLRGNEEAYLDFFYRSGTYQGRGIDPEARAAFVAAYSAPEGLRCGFEFYRAMPQSAEQIAAAVATARLRVPTMAVGAWPAGDTLYRQLRPVTDQLRGEQLPECGHIIPLDAPERLLALLNDFLS